VPCISGTRCTYGATRREIRYSASRALLSNFQIRKFDESGGEFLSHTCYTDRGGGSRGTSRTRIMIAAERACPLRRIRAYVTRRDDVGRAGVDASIDAAFSLVRFALGASPRAMTGEGVATRGGGGGRRGRPALAIGERQWRAAIERSGQGRFGACSSVLKHASALDSPGRQWGVRDSPRIVRSLVSYVASVRGRSNDRVMIE
jgi:hypothetical protein